MIGPCPCCGASAERSLVEVLRERCAEHGHYVLLDDTVHEDVAASLLGLAVGTLRNWRCSGQGPPFRRVRGGRVRYALGDLAVELLNEGE